MSTCEPGNTGLVGLSQEHAGVLHSKASVCGFVSRKGAPSQMLWRLRVVHR